MPRDQHDARRRLRQAALELYLEKGFDQTTASQIAARAGVTERTFFRHFPDKREVVFEGDEEMADAVVPALLGAPRDLPPMASMLWAFRTITHMLQTQHPFYGPRAVLVAANAALRERELAKFATLTDRLAEALTQRGTAGEYALLAAQAGFAAFCHATRAWALDPSLDLHDHLSRSFGALHTLTELSPSR